MNEMKGKEKFLRNCFSFVQIIVDGLPKFQQIDFFHVQIYILWVSYGRVKFDVVFVVCLKLGDQAVWFIEEALKIAFWSNIVIYEAWFPEEPKASLHSILHFYPFENPSIEKCLKFPPFPFHRPKVMTTYTASSEAVHFNLYFLQRALFALSTCNACHEVKLSNEHRNSALSRGKANGLGRAHIV
jgi:hypothetical protein